jgi:hypothetical protein
MRDIRGNIMLNSINAMDTSKPDKRS